MNLRAWMAAGKRALSGSLAFVMTTVLVLGNTQITLADDVLERFFAEASELTDDGTYSVATVSNASLRNEEKQGLVISVFSEESDFRAGGEVTLDVHIKNDSGVFITDGSLWARARGTEDDSAYFEQLEESTVYAGGEYWEEDEYDDEMPLIDDMADIELELDIDPVAEAESWKSAKWDKDTESAREDAEENEADNEGQEDERLEKITDIDLAPGEVYSVRYHFVISENIEKQKNQTVKFYFDGKDENNNRIRENEDYLYTVNYLNLESVRFEEGNRVYTGEEVTMGIHSFMYDFDALLWDSFVDTPSSPSDATETATPSNAAPVKATPSNAEEDAAPAKTTQSNATERDAAPARATSSNATASRESTLKKTVSQATPANAAYPYDYDDDGVTYVVDLQDTNYKVEMFNARLNDFEVRKALVNDADENMLVCTFRVLKNVEPGIYFGKITQESKYRHRTYRSTQGFALIVEGEGEITMQGSLGNTVVTVSGPASAFPEADELEVRVSELDEETRRRVADAMQKKAEEVGEKLQNYILVDVSLYADGEKIQPEDRVEMTIEYNQDELSAQEDFPTESAESVTEQDTASETATTKTMTTKTRVFHFDEEKQEAEILESSLEEAGKVTVSTTGFCPVAVGLTGIQSTVEDVVYICDFKIDDSITGTAPFDDDDDAGNDSGGNNTIVRTFDTLSYTLYLEMKAYDVTTSYTTARISFAFVLPCTSDEAEFDTGSMAWIDTTSGYTSKLVEANGQQILYCSYLMASADNTAVVSGTRTANVSISVKGMKNGDTIQPKFYAWMDGNQVYGQNTRDDDNVYDNIVLDDQTACSEHAGETNGGKEMWYAAGDVVTVSAKLKMNIYLSPITSSTLETYNFSSGDPTTASNYGLGDVYGAAFQIGVSVQLYNDSALKGLKGLEYPKGAITFNLDIESSLGGYPLVGNDYDFTPLLYSCNRNENSTNAGADGRSVSPIYSIPYATRRSNDANAVYYSCYDGGDWSAAQDGTKISVTVTNYAFDETFPITTASKSSGGISQTIASNIGTISTGKFQFVIPFYNVRKGGKNGNSADYILTKIVNYDGISVTIRDNSLAATSINGTELGTVTDTSNQMVTTDDAQTNTMEVDPPGNYYNAIYYVQRWGWNNGNELTSGCWYNGHDWAYPGQKMGILAGLGSVDYAGNSNNYIVGYDDFIKIDADAIELTDEYTGETDADKLGMLFYSSGGYSGKNTDPEEGADGQADYYLTRYDATTIQDVSHVSLLYAVLDDGENWDSEDDMRSATQEDSNIRFYDSLTEANDKGKIVGILVQLRGDISVTPKISINAKIKDDAETDETYMITDTLRLWTRRSLTTLNTARQTGTAEITAIPVRTTAQGSGYDPDVYCTSDVLTANFKPSYIKLTYNNDGSTSGDSPTGGQYGDTVLVVGYTTGIDINVLNTKGATAYSLDDGQSIVDYSIEPVVILSDDNTGASGGAAGTTTVTVEVTLPAGLTYINGSSYWGGDYTEPSVCGQQGTVNNGTSLEEGGSVTYTYTYWNASLQEVEVTITIAMTVTVNSDGTTTLTWVFSDVPLIDSGEAGGLGSLAELLYFSAFIESGSGTGTQWSLSAEAEISGSGDKRGRTASNGNLAETGITVTQLNASGISETVDPVYNEVDSELTWIITHSNNGTTDESTLLLSILPTSGYSGTYTLSGWSIDASQLSSGTSLTLYYTFDDMAGKNAASYEASDITASGSGWRKMEEIVSGSGEIALTAAQISDMENLTAWVLIGTLGTSGTIVVTESIQTSGNEGGDSYQNVASYRTSSGNSLASYATAYIRARSLSGLVWLDADGDGYQDDDEGSLGGIYAALLKLKDGGDADTESDYEAVCYKDSADAIVITTGQQVDILRATSENDPTYIEDYTDGDGRSLYLFKNLMAGTYAVKFYSSEDSGDFQFIDEETGQIYWASQQNQGTDDTIDSDAAPSPAYDVELNYTWINAIEMPEITALSSSDYLSANHDSGVYKPEKRLRVIKYVLENGQNKEPILSSYKFLIHVTGEGNTFETTLALGTTEDMERYIDLDGVKGETTLKLEEIVPMEYAQGDMIRINTPDTEADREALTAALTSAAGAQTADSVLTAKGYSPAAVSDGKVTLFLGDDVTVILTNVPTHVPYFHHTASITNHNTSGTTSGFYYDGEDCYDEDTDSESTGATPVGSTNVTFVALSDNSAIRRRTDDQEGGDGYEEI